MQQQPDLDAIIKRYGGTVAPPPTPAAQGVDLDAIIRKYGGTTTPSKARKSAAFKGLVEHYATQAGLDPELVYRVIDAESNGNPKAVSPKKAKGLMQLMDATAAEYAVSDPFDPEQNIRAGTSYLKKLLDQYGGDEAKALAAYNAGPTAVNKHNGVPPYPETQAYVAKITAGRGGQQAPPAPTPAGSDLDIVSYTPDEAPAEAAPSGPIQPRAQGVTDQTPRIGPQTTLGKIKEGVGDFVQNFPPLRMIQGAANAVKTAGDEVVSGLPQMARGIAQLTPAGSAIPGMNTVIRPSQTPEEYAKGLNDLAEGSMKVGAPLIIPALAANPAFTAAMIAAATVASDQAAAFAKRAGWGEEYQRLAGNAAALTTLGLGGKRLTGAALRGVESMARDVGVKIGQRIKQAPPEAARGLEPPTMEAEVVAGGRGPQRPREAPTGEPAGQAEIAGYPAPVPPEARPIPVTAEEGNWPPRQEPVAPEAAVAPAQPEPPPPPPVAPVQPEPPAPEVPVAPPISPSPAQAENVIRPPSESAPEPVAPTLVVDEGGFDLLSKDELHAEVERLKRAAFGNPPGGTVLDQSAYERWGEAIDAEDRLFPRRDPTYDLKELGKQTPEALAERFSLYEVQTALEQAESYYGVKHPTTRKLWKARSLVNERDTREWDGLSPEGAIDVAPTIEVPKQLSEASALTMAEAQERGMSQVLAEGYTWDAKAERFNPPSPNAVAVPPRTYKTAEEYRAGLEQLADEIAEYMVGEGRGAYSHEAAKAQMERENRFERIADEIELAKKKRGYLLARANWRRLNPGKGEPTLVDLASGPVDMLNRIAPKDTDFSPDRQVRRARNPQPIANFLTKAQIEASLNDAQRRLERSRLTPARRAKMEAIVAKRKEQLETGQYQEAQIEERALAAPVEAPPPAPVEAAPVAPVKPVATKTGDYIQVDARQIKVAPKVYQFKESDAEGVTGALRNVAEWDELQGRATPVVLHQTTDGTLYVADGHQRVNLAQRLLAQGKPVPPLNAVVYREADGYTAADMRRVAALVNVRQDSATAVDIAKLLREGPLSEQEQATIPKNNVRGERFAQAQELTKLSDPAFQAVVNGEIPAAQAQFVGRHVTDPAQQVAAIRALAKADLPNAYQAERFVKELVRDTFATETQLDMFGEHHVAFSLAKEKAQVLDAVKRALSSQKSAFGNALRNQAKLEGAGNVLNADVNAQLATEAGRFQALLDVFADKSGYTQAALRDAARRVHDRELSPADAVDAVIAALERDFRGDPPPSGGPSAPAESGGGRPSDGRGVGSESGGDRGPDEVLPVSRAELEAAGQSSMFGEGPAAPPVASPKLAESKAAFDAAKGPDPAPLEPGRVVTNEFGEGDRMLPGRMEELAGKLKEQPVIATPDELGKMIAAQKAKIAEAKRRATNINYRVSGPARDSLPGLEAGLVELEKLAGIKKPEDAKPGDLLADAPNGLDAYAMRHLDKWLEDTVREDERDRLKNRIVDLLADHPEMIDRGWPALRDIVESIYNPAPVKPPRPQVVQKTTLDELPNPNGKAGPFRLVRQEKDNGDVFYSVLHTAEDGVQFGQSFASEAEARAWRDGAIAHEAERVKAAEESDAKAAAEGKATLAQRQSAFRYIERQRNKGWARGNFAQAYWDFLQGERDAPDPTGVGPVVRFDIIAELTRIAGKESPASPSKAEAARDAFTDRKKGRRT